MPDCLRPDSHGPNFEGCTGVHHDRVAVNDIAPTLAALLEIETPSGSSGKILSGILK